MLFKLIIPSCDYCNMGSVLVYQRVKEESGFHMHANIQTTVKARGCILLPLFLYIMELCLLSCYKAHNFIICKNNGNKNKKVFT